MKFHKTRHTLAETKCEIEMTPTLDIIFQLLIFFILTFKPITDEGQFGVNMSNLPGGSLALPTVVPGMGDDTASPDVQFIPPLRVLLSAGPGGHLSSSGIAVGDVQLQSLDYLRFHIRSLVRGSADEYEVVIEADPKLQYQYIVQAVNAISRAGVRKINFGAPATSGS